MHQGQNYPLEIDAEFWNLQLDSEQRHGCCVCCVRVPPPHCWISTVDIDESLSNRFHNAVPVANKCVSIAKAVLCLWYASTRHRKGTRRDKMRKSPLEAFDPPGRCPLAGTAGQDVLARGIVASTVHRRLCPPKFDRNESVQDSRCTVPRILELYTRQSTYMAARHSSCCTETRDHSGKTV